MTTVTLESAKVQLLQLATDLIAKLEASVKTPYLYVVREAMVLLNPGERYAGIVLDDDGQVSHHLVLMAPHPEERMTWQAAQAWAVSVGGELPTRREQSLLFANLKPEFGEAWYWSSEQYEDDGAYAWLQYFGTGTQFRIRTSVEARVRAVRRFIA